MLQNLHAQRISEAVKESVVLQPRAKLLAEFNNNRFALPVVRLNGDVFDETMDENSIMGINRPVSEIRYGTVGFARAADDSGEGEVYRVAGEDLAYEYLRSNVLGRANDDVFDVQVTHTNAPANALLLNFNTHEGRVGPRRVEVYWQQPYGWTTTGVHSVNSTGELVLYRQEDETWSTRRYLENPLPNCYGIRVVVREGPPDGHVELVELASMFITDLSDFLVSFSLKYSKDEPTVAQPLGVRQSGSLELELDDTSNRFAQTQLGTYRRYAERDAKFMLSLGYRIEGQDYYVDLPEYWADSWNIDSDLGSVSISCTDRSRWIQRATVQDSIFESKTVPFIIRELLESVGIAGVNVQQADDDVEVLPWVWYRNGESLWDALAEVSKAVNSSFYYNEEGMLTWVSKNKAYEQEVPVYKFDSRSSGDRLPNLFGVQQSFEEVFNSTKVSYEELEPNTNSFGKPTRQPLWQPQGDTLLRSAPLLQPIESRVKFPAPIVDIGAEAIALWPFSGKFQIEGETFSYEGKKHTNGKVSTDARQAALHGALSGEFANVERAVDGTTPDRHSFGRLLGAVTKFNTTTIDTAYPLAKATLHEGAMRLNSKAAGSLGGYNSYAACTRGSDIDSYETYGTELRFPLEAQGRGENIAGMLLHRQSGNSNRGYYFELLTDDYVLNKRHGAIGNVRCYRNDGSGNIGLPLEADEPQDELTALGGNGRRGYFFPVEYGTALQLEVIVGHNQQQQQTFYVYINGQYITKFTDETYTSGLWGVFARGDTIVDFENFYAYERDADSRFITEEQFITGIMAKRRLYDRITGAYTYAGPELAQAGRAGFYRWFFEEFQPVVHERRDLNVEHSVSPAFNFALLNSNPAGVQIHSLLHTPFRTKFAMENSSRLNEYVAGTDPAGGQYLLQLFGQPLARIDSQQIVEVHQPSVAEHGISEFEFDNPWIQSEEQAREQARYITERWSKPVDVLQVDVTYDPAIELGDLVEVEHFERRIFSRLYFVTSVEVSWDEGFSCRLTLRRNHLYYSQHG